MTFVHRFSVRTLVLVGVGLVIAGALSLASLVEAQTITSVSMVNNVFRPQTVTIAAGTTVVWLNNDQHYHAVVSDAGHFQSGILYQGNTYQHTFTMPGTYYYHDQFYGSARGGMWGVVLVTGNSMYGGSQYSPYQTTGYNNPYQTTGATSYYPSYNYGSTYGTSYPYTSGSAYTYPYAAGRSYAYPYSGSTYYNPSTAYAYPSQTYSGTGYTGYSYPYSTAPSAYTSPAYTASSYTYPSSYSPYSYSHNTSSLPTWFRLSCSMTYGTSYVCQLGN